MLNSTDIAPNKLAPSDPLELAEQCLALISVVVKLEDAPVKESLQFILYEKMAALFSVLYASNG
ncbi:hypothetical protein EKN56_19125 [Limnobaculum zhutongyuii]|uniref:Uncharacterized protein n=1 Tax=Limnobaculum zhutongyuii TaxID=2498113 RepID=A0A411WQ48_9GAMM|nr:hypothetical protein [Limnobaculum zhutongyuii]QBH98317.1 hypothetical protein EKN56_19125 [Limnobaculum zhutongyuii]TQS89786.1 hypothetical protein ELQ32_05115 [Limnobaculum zhutongyuii]